MRWRVPTDEGSGSSPEAPNLARRDGVAAVREGGRYRWWESAAPGWVCDAEWSTRAEGREAGEIARINGVVRRACGV
jgi:hypothetical protein